FYNAKFLVDAGAALLLEQKEITSPAGNPALLERTILELFKDPQRLEKMRQKSFDLAKVEAVSLIVDELEKICTVKAKD
ncbi:MAG: glycosyltransferase, partial [Candidatus Adiutrix sp.]